MIVRIRFKAGPEKLAPVVAMPAPVAPEAHAPVLPLSGLGGLLTPVAVLAAALAAWRLAADLGLAHEFLITEGVLSRWQVWFAGAVALQAAAYGLGRRAAPRGMTPESLPPAAQLHADRHAGRGR